MSSVHISYVCKDPREFSFIMNRDEWKFSVLCSLEYRRMLSMRQLTAVDDKVSAV